MTTLALSGCLPPVQETPDGNQPKVSAEAPEKPAAAASQEPAATPEGFEKTASGLMYKIAKAGGKKPTASDKVRVHYKGWLDDGTIFDQSYGGKPLEIGLYEVVPGWKEGIPLIGEGGEIELQIPSDLGYGPSGQGPIPPNATLHFKVELLKIL